MREKVSSMAERIAVGLVAEGSGDKEEYMRFFKKTLKKYDVDSPADLEEGKRKKFYEEIDSGWESDEESSMSGPKIGRRSSR